MTKFNKQLDAEEREILERFERDELRRKADAGDEIEAAHRAARNTLSKSRRVDPPATEPNPNISSSG